MLPIHHWQTTVILPTADRKVAIDTSTDIQCVVIASIDCHSIECQRKLKVCRPRCRPCVNRGSTEGRPRCRSSVDRGLIEVSIASIDWHSIAGVNSTHDPYNFARNISTNNSTLGQHTPCILQFLDFIHWMVFDFIFYYMTMNTHTYRFF